MRGRERRSVRQQIRSLECPHSGLMGPWRPHLEPCGHWGAGPSSHPRKIRHHPQRRQLPTQRLTAVPCPCDRHRWSRLSTLWGALGRGRFRASL